MADPFDVVGSGNPNFWQNLMNFGMATMAAGAQPGARTLGALGQGGIAAMTSARENALARTQNQLYSAEAQSKLMQNSVALNQINMQRMGLGLPPLEIPGMQGSQGAQSSGQAAQQGGAQTPPNNSAGMTFSPTSGHQFMSNAGGGAQGAQPAAATSYDPTRLSAIGAGKAQPQTPAEAAAAAPWAQMMGFADRAKELNSYALAGPIDSSKVHAIAPGGAAYQNGQIVAMGAQDAVTPGGAKYRVPAQATGGASSSPDTSLSLGIRNNNPGNLRPSGDKWQGMTGQESGYLKFDTPEAGIRAASINLRNYGAKGINTPMTIAATWAPASDNNDPVAYGKNLAAQLNMSPDQQLNLDDPATNAGVLHALFKNENTSVPYDSQTLLKGVASAFMPEEPKAAKSNPYGTPEGALLTEIPPGVAEFTKGRGGELSKKMGEIDEQAESAKQANFLLDQMTLDSTQFTPGKFANVGGELGKYVRTIDPKFDGSVAAYERFKKNAITLTNEEVRQVSNRAAVQEYQAIQAAQPQPDMSPLGIKMILNQKYAVNDYKLSKQEAANNWLSSHPTIEGFESDFNKKISPAVFMVSRMSPQDLQVLRTNLLKKPEGQRILDNITKKIQSAQEMGIIE